MHQHGSNWNGVTKQTHSTAIRRPNIKAVILIQLLLVLLIGIALWQLRRDFALSVIYGSAVFLIPNSYFAWRSFQYSGAAKARQVAESFYRGQAAKFLLTMLMFAALFILQKPTAEMTLLVFVSYGLNALFHSIGTAIVLNRPIQH